MAFERFLLFKERPFASVLRILKFCSTLSRTFCLYSWGTQRETLCLLFPTVWNSYSTAKPHQMLNILHKTKMTLKWFVWLLSVMKDETTKTAEEHLKVLFSELSNFESFLKSFKAFIGKKCRKNWSIDTKLRKPLINSFSHRFHLSLREEI